MESLEYTNKKNVLVILDIIRIINLLNITMIIGLIMDCLISNKYVVFIAVIILSTLLAYFSQIFFIKHYKTDAPLFKSKLSIAFSVIVNIFVLSYFFLIKQYILAMIFISFMVAYFIILKIIQKKKLKKNKKIKWEVV